MKPKPAVTLDELDVKCLSELPLILDVVAATGNKLTRIFNPLYEDILNFIKGKMPTGWSQSKENYKSVFYPFVDQYKKDDITTLYSYFSLYYEINLVPANLAGNNGIVIQMGFYYDADDEEYKRPCYYFEITRSLTKRMATYNSLAFYQQLRSRIENNDLNVRIYHPESGEKEEDIAIIVYNHSVEIINDAFETFKNEVLLPFLQSIN